jgi:hypothetical protein
MGGIGREQREQAVVVADDLPGAVSDPAVVGVDRRFRPWEP